VAITGCRGLPSQYLRPIACFALKSYLIVEAIMQYKVIVEESDEGFAVSVPGLPGCHSQGATEKQALENIADAIREYLAVAAELARSGAGHEAEVEV
jgi:predicted RNase H-like HicB family nuclease